MPRHFLPQINVVENCELCKLPFEVSPLEEYSKSQFFFDKPRAVYFVLAKYIAAVNWSLFSIKSNKIFIVKTILLVDFLFALRPA